MPPEPAFIMGLLLGVFGLLLIQLYGRRRAKKAVGQVVDHRLVQENQRLSGEVDDLHARLAVLEEIATDPAQRTSREIEKLR